MADSIASPLLQSLILRLDSLCLSFGDGDELLNRLRSVVAAVKDVAAAAEQRFEVAEEIKRWLSDVKRVASELDYLLDDYELQMRKVRNQKLFRSCFCFLSENQIRRQLERVLQNLTTLASKGDWSLETSCLPDLYFRLCSRNSFVDLEPEIFGRDVDRDKIVHLLLSNRQQEHQVVSIVGTGGVGKTTLAHLVYNDEKVTRNYLFKYWVSFGTDFDVGIERIGEAICSRKISTRNDLVESVTRELMGKKFLLVLDNWWYEERALGIMLREWFSAGSPGSAVIVTTRSTAAADSLGAVTVYYLQRLPDRECLDMFSKLALLPREEKEENIKLLEISKVLVGNCRGLPLSVKILGSLLPYNGELDDWLSAASLALLELQKYSYTSTILPVLRLSYDLLPSYLKQCFAFCSIFPREFWIDKEKLLQLWNAEGFLQTSGSSESLDDIAEDCFTKLLQRSFFEEIIRDDSGDIFCRMHDLVYDFALTISSTTCSVMGKGNFKHNLAELQHCSLTCESEHSTDLINLSTREDLQTLLVLSGKFDRIPDTIFSRLQHLRVLDFSQSGIHELSVLIGALKHMRYLDLSGTYIRKIPDSIGNLMYLHTLELSECYNLEELPRTVHQLTKLENLDIRSCCSLTHFPPGIGKLRLLKTLPMFLVGKTSDCAKLNELSDLDLSGSLEIKNLENVLNQADAEDAKLSEKVSLHSLGLSWGHSDYIDAQVCAEILESLSPPQNLHEFCLKGYKGYSFPSWMYQCLPNLLKISLINCSCPVLPPLGQLPFLKVLYLKGMPEVHRIGHEYYGYDTVRGFPCLEQLDIHDMPNLEEWVNMKREKTEIIPVVSGSSDLLSQEAFPRLDKLVIEGCQNLISLPVISNLRSLALRDSNVKLLLSVVHLPSLSSLVIEKLMMPRSLVDDFECVFSIEKLTLWDFDHLDYLFGGNLAFSCLKNLSILYCDRLTSLPFGLRLLTSIQRIEVMGCGQLNDISVLQSLSSLQELVIEDCPMLHSVPSLHNLSNFQSLIIKDVPAKNKATSGGSNSIKATHNSNTIPCVSKQHQLPNPDPLPESEAALVLLSEGDCSPISGRNRIHIEIGKDHRIAYPERGTGSGHGWGEARSGDQGMAIMVVPEVSHLGWGHCYTLRELEESTNDFASENVIGEGGYGIVFRGVLLDNTKVAVKSLLNNRGQAEKEFKVEVEAIGLVRHKNLVRLLGYCAEGAHRMLVYEYVDNGNLEQWLHEDFSPCSSLTWEIRMNIVLGTAKGLTYLHEGHEPHRDIKSSNILLDKQWNPKISDFGLAKLLSSERSYVTTRVMGTFGYLAPEYASSGMLNEGSDVYSFGILLMEIISGRKPVDYSLPQGEVNLVEWLKTMVANRNAEAVLDPRLPEKPSSRALKRAILVALRCVDPNAQKRPRMGHVIRMLEVDEFPFRDDSRAGRENMHTLQEVAKDRLTDKRVNESGDSSGYESGAQTTKSLWRKQESEE